MTADVPAVLRTDGVTKTFGGIRAVDRCSLAIHAGRITGLIGPNGAGKTTLFNLIAGLYAPDEGSISLRGERIDGRPPFEIVHKGVVKTFQIPREFRHLTVLENLMVASPDHPGERPVSALVGWRRVWDREEEIREKAAGVLSLVELDRLSDADAGELSGGQKKLLGIIEGLRDRGSTFFMIEHDMDVVMKRCDHVIAMHQGRAIAEGSPEEVRQNELVMDAYLGG